MEEERTTDKAMERLGRCDAKNWSKMVGNANKYEEFADVMKTADVETLYINRKNYDSIVGTLGLESTNKWLFSGYLTLFFLAGRNYDRLTTLCTEVQGAIMHMSM